MTDPQHTVEGLSQDAVIEQVEQHRDIRTGVGETLMSMQDVTLRFGGLTALDSVSFDIKRGEILGLIGPNGAGKTTCFNAMTGVYRPTSGTITFDGTVLKRQRRYQITRLGIARTFQNIRLFANLSAVQNVMIAQHIHTRSGVISGTLGLPPAPEEERRVRRRAEELLEMVGLQRRAREAAHNLPYGDQRRLEIARALALEPRLLLLDEPAAGMNPNEKGELSSFIRSLRDRFDLTIVLIEHHVPLVMGLCDRIAVLNFGQLIALGDPAAVQQDPAVIDAYLGAE
jgi:branched-chain amino acid transport system ATP-binding protein